MATRLSPSRASDFKQCPQLYKYRVIEKRKEPPSRATLQGTIVHHVLELLFEREPDERTIDVARDLVGPSMATHRDEIEVLPEVESAIAGGSASAAADAESEIELFVREMVDAYFDLEDPSALDTVARELRIEEDLGGIRVTGIIDRLDRDSDGTYVISDYKTGKAPNPKYREKAFFGLRVYAALIEQAKEIGEAPSRLRLIYLKSKEILEMPVDPAHLRGTKSQIAAIAQAVDTATERDHWPPNPGRLCDWCYFKPICPAFSDSGDTELGKP